MTLKNTKVCCVLEVIDEVDTSGLGTLNLDEFKAIMQLTLGVKTRIVAGPT